MKVGKILCIFLNPNNTYVRLQSDSWQTVHCKFSVIYFMCLDRWFIKEKVRFIEEEKAAIICESLKNHEPISHIDFDVWKSCFLYISFKLKKSTISARKLNKKQLLCSRNILRTIPSKH